MRKFTLYIFILLSSFSYSIGQNLDKEQELSFVKKVYPNPVENFVFIEISQDNYTYAKIELIDILGNKVKSWQPEELFPGTQKIKLILDNLRPGMYLLKIEVDGKMVVKRIRRL